ncbi:MAG: type I DNA topoisomerase [Elusimicrobiota bacterium]|jgi:DNA topoisomerase-1|nr:type I DNA topoisomerase [Elusimicrobiota bacterium]
MKLIIVESPAKCKTIGKILGSGYKIIATMGHVRDLPKNRLGVDVDKDFKPTYEVSKDRKDAAQNIVNLIKKADEIYIATDEDREGEAIGWHIVELSKLNKKNFKRITFHEITPSAIKNAVKNPRDLNYNLIDAQQARRILDRLVGYNLSPLLSRKIYKGLSAGRVQSSTLKLIVDREKEIKNFKTEEYWTIDAICEKNEIKFNAKFIEKDGKTYNNKELKTKKDVDEILKSIDKDKFFVKDIEKKERLKKASPPFITSSLQQVASKILGFSSKKTMMIAQNLYEGVKIGDSEIGLITYMRTDSTAIAKDALDEVRAFIDKEFGVKFLPKKANIFKTKDKNAQEAHECVRPTSTIKTPKDIKEYLAKDEFRLYELIWQRFVGSQMKEAIFNQNIVKIVCNDTLWNTVGETKIFDGYLKVYKADDISKDVILPELEVGEKVLVTEIEPKQHFTEPPTRYTEATLIKTMEKNGIGRPSTYAPTISNILQRGYVKIEEKKLFPESIGIEVTEMLEQFFPKIVNPDFTAKMESSLDNIAVGKEKWIQMLTAFYKPFSKILQEAIEKIPPKELQKVDKKCPQCGADLVIRKSKYGEFIGCSGYPKCKYIEKETVSRNTDNNLEKDMDNEYSNLGKCPRCGSDLVIKKSRYGKFIACSGYPKCKYSKNLDSIKIDKKCPDCGGDLVVKASKRGKFLGCSNYPTCKHVEKL